MSRAHAFEDLKVWQLARELVRSVYLLTKDAQFGRDQGLRDQIRRAAVSCMANIAEGFRKRGKPDKVRFLNIAEGSIEESRYYLILALDLGYGQTCDLMNLLEEVSRLINAYSKAILTPDF